MVILGVFWNIALAPTLWNEHSMFKACMYGTTLANQFIGRLVYDVALDLKFLSVKLSKTLLFS